MHLFSERTLDIIGKNIERSSLALNNPQLFYRNYFTKVVDDNNEKKKNVSTKLKEIEKIIQKGQKSKRRTKSVNEINLINNLNNDDKIKDNSDKRSM